MANHFQIRPGTGFLLRPGVGRVITTTTRDCCCPVVYPPCTDDPYVYPDTFVVDGPVFTCPECYTYWTNYYGAASLDPAPAAPITLTRGPLYDGGPAYQWSFYADGVFRDAGGAVISTQSAFWRARLQCGGPEYSFQPNWFFRSHCGFTTGAQPPDIVVVEHRTSDQGPFGFYTDVVAHNSCTNSGVTIS